jgi:hypothetical protein
MTLQTFSIPGAIAVALSTDLPQFIDIYINNQVDEEKKELGRLIKTLIEDRTKSMKVMGELRSRLDDYLNMVKGAMSMAKSIDDLMDQAEAMVAGRDPYDPLDPNRNAIGDPDIRGNY